VTVIDCFTRQIVGWTLDQRCRAKEWSAAVREALESRGLIKKSDCQNLVLRSDNGAQPCSKKFTQFLKRRGVIGQYTRAYFISPKVKFLAQSASRETL